MNLKIATLIAFIGNSIQTLFHILLNMRILEWSHTYYILSLILGNGSLLFFLGVLYSKQK